jgi:hypothetical protein
MMIMMLSKDYDAEDFYLYRNDNITLNEFNTVMYSMDTKIIVENEDFEYGDIFYTELADRFRNNQHYIYY